MIDKNKIASFFNSKTFFVVFLFIIIGSYIYTNRSIGIGNLNSDIWMNNFIVTQEKHNYWSEVPPLYNAEEFYVAYPLIYYLNPGLQGGIIGYHILSIVVISLIYLINGLVVKKIFNSWFFASISGALLLIPRNVLPSTIGVFSAAKIVGSTFVYPLYLLLSYYWIIYGIQDRKRNIILAIIAGMSVYLYPPYGLITNGLFFITCFFIHKKKYLKEMTIFAAIYLVIASPFLANHFLNPNTSMLGGNNILSAEDLKIKSEILHYRFGANGFLASLDLATIKRGLWDSTPLFLAFLFSLFFYKKMRKQFNEDQVMALRIGMVFISFLLIFTLGVEIVNTYMSHLNRPPIFVEHLRLMRAMGFILIVNYLLVMFYLNKTNRKLISAILLLIIAFLPLYFSKHYVRAVVRLTVPEKIRMKYNLAPVVNAADVRSFKNLKDVAYWTKDNLSKDVKIFTFASEGHEFQFKIMSQRDTNITGKEGSIWVTSTIDNARRWYYERKEYDQLVENITDFTPIVAFAKELNCTHILIPRGEFSNSYDNTKLNNITEVYSNPDYKLIQIN